eukprot:389334_1
MLISLIVTMSIVQNLNSTQLKSPMAATALVALSLLISHSNANLIDCANTVDCTGGSTQTCMANEDCTIFCNGTALATRICKDATFNCPQSYTCTLICDNNGWTGGTGTAAGRVCQGITINGASNGNLFVTANSELNHTHATNEIMQDGTVNCGSSSICNVICAGAQSCENVIINGNTNTQINVQAITLETVTVGFVNHEPFRFGKINCATYENCNIDIKCLGQQSCPSAQIIGGNNAILNLFATGEDAMISLGGVTDNTKILCPQSGECNIICECGECDDTEERICDEIIIDGENSDILTINAVGADVLFDAQIICPMDSSPDECVIIINDNTDNFELTNVQIIANNGFLGFTLDCSQSIPCWTTNSGDPAQPTWNAPIVICDVAQGLNCSIQAVNEEWNVFRCMEQGDDCDVSLSPTINPTIIPTYNPTYNPTVTPTYTTYNPSYNPTITPTYNPTYNPTITPTYSPTDSEDSDSESDSDNSESDSASDVVFKGNALLDNNKHNNLDYMTHEQENNQYNQEINVNVNLSKSSIINLWSILFLFLIIVMGVIAIIKIKLNLQQS